MYPSREPFCDANRFAQQPELQIMPARTTAWTSQGKFGPKFEPRTALAQGCSLPPASGLLRFAAPGQKAVTPIGRTAAIFNAILTP
jgi:hypothetical protein